MLPAICRALRQVVLDVETTGLNTSEDRIVEIAAIELQDFQITGNVYESRINPRIPIGVAASRIHGISYEDIKTKPVFSEVAHDILSFIGTSPVVAHNGFDFDFKLLNAELARVGQPQIPRSQQIDTLVLARRLLTRAPSRGYSLDSLADHFEVDRRHRHQHGALIDCKILVQVYRGIVGDQRDLGEFLETSSPATTPRETPTLRPQQASRARVRYASSAEIAADQALRARFKLRPQV